MSCFACDAAIVRSRGCRRDVRLVTERRAAQLLTLRSREYLTVASKKVLRSLVAVWALSVAQTALACGTNYCSDTIGKFVVQDGYLYIKPTNGVSGLTNCTLAAPYYLTIPTTDPQYSHYFAALLAAQFAGQSVTLRTLDGSSNCSIGYITIPRSHGGVRSLRVWL
jgi:hypothetical protein